MVEERAKVKIPTLPKTREGWGTLQFVLIQIAWSITLRKAGRPPLAAKALNQGLIAGQIRGEHFDRRRPIQRNLDGLYTTPMPPSPSHMMIMNAKTTKHVVDVARQVPQLTEERLNASHKLALIRLVM